VFGELDGVEAGTMWRMLTSRPDSDLRQDRHPSAGRAGPVS